MLPFTAPRRHRSAGFTLAEMMISMAVGMLLLAGMATIFVTNNRAQSELEKSNRQVENGRYAMQIMSADLSNAGYYGEFDPVPLPAPPATPVVCASTLEQVKAALRAPVQGIDNATSTDAACLPGLKAGTDVLIVRRVQTCLLGEGTCAPASAGGIFFQGSLCQRNDELGAGDSSRHYRLDTVIANLDRRARDCSGPTDGTKAPIRRLVVRIYYVATDHRTDDGVPTLMLAELTPGTGGVLSWEVQPMVEGIENLQLEFGVDNNANRTPDLYTPDPVTATNCGAACAATRWSGVVAAKVHLLARNTKASPGFTDTKSYSLGLDAAQDDNVVAAANDQFKRHVFQSTVAIPNTAGRSAP